MAHPEHLAILQHGVARWNAWRVEHPRVRPDLADLDADRDLRALYTSDDPFDLYLDGINLADALLDAARFEQVSFAGADMSNAHLGGAVIRYCSLRNASLEGADLTSAELTNTTLNGCRVGRAIVRRHPPATPRPLTGGGTGRRRASLRLHRRRRHAGANGLRSRPKRRSDRRPGVPRNGRGACKLPGAGPRFSLTSGTSRVTRDPWDDVSGVALRDHDAAIRHSSRTDDPHRGGVGSRLAVSCWPV